MNITIQNCEINQASDKTFIERPGTVMIIGQSVIFDGFKIFVNRNADSLNGGEMVSVLRKFVMDSVAENAT